MAQLSDENIDEFLDEDLPVKMTVMPGIRQVHGVVKADPKDDKILATAAESGAGYVVTEEMHLLDLEDWGGIKIMSRAHFDAELDRVGVAR